MQRSEEVLKRLWHIMGAGTTIAKWTRERTFDEFLGSQMLRSAVERQFTNVGEALRVALRADPTLANSISDTAAIIAFRHMLVHGYSAINSEFVWVIIHDRLPLLLDEVRLLLGPTPA